jgi:predicted RNase H-like nuclease (RuvC/YqgF family)
MPTKKVGTRARGVPSGADAPAWQVILEEIKSQNRSTIEAVESSRTALEQRIDRLDQESRARDAVLEGAIRHLGADLRRIDANVEKLDGKVTELDGKVERLDGKVTELDRKVEKVDAKVEGLVVLEERVTALEQPT